MENATKALLIAAAVLIAIVLVALGVNLLGAAGDTTKDVENVSTALNQATQNAAANLVTDITTNF